MSALEGAAYDMVVDVIDSLGACFGRFAAADRAAFIQRGGGCGRR